MEIGGLSHQVKPSADKPKEAKFVSTVISFSMNMRNKKCMSLVSNKQFLHLLWICQGTVLWFLKAKVWLNLEKLPMSAMGIFDGEDDGPELCRKRVLDPREIWQVTRERVCTIMLEIQFLKWSLLCWNLALFLACQMQLTMKIMEEVIVEEHWGLHPPLMVSLKDYITPKLPN